MSWSLSASGHSLSKEAEERLHNGLKELLSKEEAGTYQSWFGGSHFWGHLHQTTGEQTMNTAVSE